jgi:hypothetical protein
MCPLLLRLSTASLMIFSVGLNCIPSATSFLDPASALTSPGCVSLGNLHTHKPSKGSSAHSFPSLLKCSYLLGHFVVGVELGYFGGEVTPVTDGLDAGVPAGRCWVLEQHDVRQRHVFHMDWSQEVIGILLCAT